MTREVFCIFGKIQYNLTFGRQEANLKKIADGLGVTMSELFEGI